MTFAAWYDNLPTIDEVHIGLDAVCDDDTPANWSTAPIDESAFFYVILTDHMGHACPDCDRDLVRRRGVPPPVRDRAAARADWSLGLAEMFLGIDVWP